MCVRVVAPLPLTAVEPPARGQRVDIRRLHQEKTLDPGLARRDLGVRVDPLDDGLRPLCEMVAATVRGSACIEIEADQDQFLFNLTAKDDPLAADPFWLAQRLGAIHGGGACRPR